MDMIDGLGAVQGCIDDDTRGSVRARSILQGAPMKVDGKPMRTIWVEADGAVGIIDQTKLPHRFETRRLLSLAEAAHAIKSMQVRGAPLIGAAAAYGIALGLRADTSDQ